MNNKLLLSLCLSLSLALTQGYTQCLTIGADTTLTCGSAYNLVAAAGAVRYTLGTTPCTPVALGSPTNAFPIACDDCVTGQIPIGFNFNFYGNTYSSVVISSNGLVGFGAFTFTGYSPFTIPAAGVPNNYIAGIMADLDIRNGGTIEYQLTGVAPNRRFIINYNNVASYGPGTGTASFKNNLE